MKAYIYDTVRTPRGKGKPDGALHEIRAFHLLTPLLKALQHRNELDVSMVEDIIVGCVTQIGEQSGDIAKAAALLAGYPYSVAGVTLNRFCGSGLEAVNQAAAVVISGQSDLIIAGGVESMSRVRMGSDGSALLTDPEMILEQNIVPQGISADLIATIYGYPREKLDAFAVESHRKASRAWKQGRFSKSIIPVPDRSGRIVLEVDEMVRPDTNNEVLAGLKAAFQLAGEKFGFDAVAMEKYPEVEMIRHVHHAGNSSGIVDGASLTLIGSRKAGRKLGLKPRAQIRSFAVVGAEPTIMLLGPVPASRKALKRARLHAQDIDLFEVNEAFAVVPLKYMDDMQIPPDKVNVNGGAIAMGHPLGATGSMLLGTVLDELERRDKSLGLVTLCIGGGMGIATVIERITDF